MSNDANGTEKVIRRLIAGVNKSLYWYKKGGWIDCRRTPTSDVNMVNSLEEFIEAKFNRDCWDIPELRTACELLDGFVFKCELIEPDEMKKRYKLAILTLVRESEIENPTDQLRDELRHVYKFFGGNIIKFNSVKVKVKYEVEISYRL